MKAILVVILIGSWALPHVRTCLLPLICSDGVGLPGVTGALLCNEFCNLIGALGVKRCTVAEWFDYATCIGPREENLATNAILSTFGLAWPSVCDAACESCGKTNGLYTFTDSNPFVAKCECT